MKIQINNKTYNDSTWSFDHDTGNASLFLKTTESIGEIASTFDGEDTIHAYDDNNNETGVWYIHSIIAIYENWESHRPEESRVVIVKIKASALVSAAEERLESNIDENTDAILEIAELIADMHETDIEINKIKAELHSIPKDIVETLGEIYTMYSTLADRVAVLENAQ